MCVGMRASPTRASDCVSPGGMRKYPLQAAAWVGHGENWRASDSLGEKPDETPTRHQVLGRPGDLDLETGTPPFLNDGDVLRR